jgi:membrane-associated protein
MLLGMNWMDPNWLLLHYHTEFIWLGAVLLFIECGLFFPFLPGDTLLISAGLFIATGKLHENVILVMVIFAVAAFAGNVVGYEIGRAAGTPLMQRDGRILKRYFEETHEFFEKRGNAALVVGRFVAVVRTYVTVVAGIAKMDRRRFMIWSAVGAVAWVLSITLLGYYLGKSVPGLIKHIDILIIGIVALSAIPIAIEWRNRRRRPTSDGDLGATGTTAGSDLEV